MTLLTHAVIGAAVASVSESARGVSSRLDRPLLRRCRPSLGLLHQKSDDESRFGRERPFCLYQQKHRGESSENNRGFFRRRFFWRFFLRSGRSGGISSAGRRYYRRRFAGFSSFFGMDCPNPVFRQLEKFHASVHSKIKMARLSVGTGVSSFAGRRRFGGYLFR